MQEFIFITGNPAKADYLASYFNHEVVHQALNLPEIQSLDLEEIVKTKAEAAFDRVRKSVLVEDVSLEFAALGNLPGPLVKWFLEALGNEGICQLLSGYNNRKAQAKVLFCLYDGRAYELFSGIAEGVIADQPKGERVFGWDPIFIPQGYYQTWSEMSSEEKDMTSMRRIALDKLKEWLRLQA